MSRERTVCIICGFEQPPIPGIKDGPAVPGICYDCCNAVNYLRLVRTLPRDRILAETDAPRGDGKPSPRIGQVAAGVAAALGEDVAATAELLAANAAAFVARARRG